MIQKAANGLPDQHGGYGVAGLSGGRVEERGCRERHGRMPQSLAADNTYGNGELLQWLDDRGITPYIRVKESPTSKSGLYGIDKFNYQPEENLYACPEGNRMAITAVALTFTHSTLSRPYRKCQQNSASLL
jgi:hypothetical protein